MSQQPLSELPTEDLRARLASARKVRITVTVIFASIIVVWLVGGYWRQNFLAFVATVVMAGAITAAQAASQAGVVAELRRREGGE